MAIVVDLKQEILELLHDEGVCEALRAALTPHNCGADDRAEKCCVLPNQGDGVPADEEQSNSSQPLPENSDSQAVDARGEDPSLQINAELSQQIADLQFNLATQESENTRLTQQVENLRADLITQESENSRLTQYVENLRADLVTQESENSRLSQQIADLQSNLATQESENSRLSQQIVDLQSNLATQESENSRLSQQIADLQSNLTTQESENLRLTQYVENLRAALVTQESENSRLTQQVENLRADLITQESENSRLTQYVENLRVDLTTQKSENSRLTQQIGNLQSNLAIQESENSRLTQQVENLRADLVTQESEKQHWECEFTKCQGELNHCQEQLRETAQGLVYWKHNYSDLDDIYTKYRNLGPDIIANFERVLNDNSGQPSSLARFMAFGTQENDILALWDGISRELPLYDRSGKTADLQAILTYFLELYKSVTFKSVRIESPNVGDNYDERFHTRTSSSRAVGHITRVVLPGIVIGNKMARKALVVIQ